MFISQFKSECEFRFLVDGHEEFCSEYFPGVAHIFEHEYDARTSFWWGVAEIACDAKTYDSAMRTGIPPNFTIQLRLPDGKIGAAKQVNASMSKSHQADYVVAAFIGTTSLAVPKATF